jgi:hypothetical protein
MSDTRHKMWQSQRDAERLQGGFALNDPPSPIATRESIVCPMCGRMSLLIELLWRDMRIGVEHYCSCGKLLWLRERDENT